MLNTVCASFMQSTKKPERYVLGTPHQCRREPKPQRDGGTCQGSLAGSQPCQPLAVSSEWLSSNQKEPWGWVLIMSRLGSGSPVLARGSLAPVIFPASL